MRFAVAWITRTGLSMSWLSTYPITMLTISVAISKPTNTLRYPAITSRTGAIGVPTVTSKGGRRNSPTRSSPMPLTSTV